MEIRLPEPPGDSLKVILHQGEVYRDAPLPLIIERVPRFVARPQEQGLLEYRKNRPLLSSHQHGAGEASDSQKSADDNERSELFWWAENGN